MFSLDFWGAAFAIAATVAFALASVTAWPLSLIAIIFDLILYFRLHIYGDAVLQVGYFVMSLYGWWAWQRPVAAEDRLQISWLTAKERGIMLMGLAATIPLFAYFLAKQLHSTAPVLDSTTTLLSVVSQILICRKKLDNWPLWCITDVLYLLLYYVKGIPFHMFTLPMDLFIAVMGYYRWCQLAQSPNKSATNAIPLMPRVRLGWLIQR